MIEDKKPLSMAESLEYLKNEEDKKNLSSFKKKFSKIRTEEAKKLRGDIECMKMIKVKGEQISAIIDLLPEDKESLNKIFTDVGLDNNESDKMLGAIKGIK